MKKRFFAPLLLAAALLSCSPAFAAFSVKSGTVTLNTSTGNQSVSTVGFQPKLVIFFGQMSTAVGTGGGFRGFIGAATSSSARWAAEGYVANSITPTTTTNFSQRNFSSSKCIIGDQENAAAGTLFDADFVSMDSGGFTFNVTTAPAAGRVVEWVAFGGTDLSVQVGTFNTNTATGNQDISTTFQGNLVMIVNTQGNTTEGAAANGGTLRFGAATSSSSRWAINDYTNTGATSEAKGELLTNAVLRRNSTGGGNNETADFVSFAATPKFTINIGTTNGTSKKSGYILFAGTQVATGVFTQKTSTGTDAAITGLSFQPSFILTGSASRTAAAALAADQQPSIGVAESTSSRRASAGNSKTGVSTSDSSYKLSESLVIIHTSPNTGTPTVNAEADLSSFDSGGVTWNWTTADATARESGYFVLAQSGAAAGTPSAYTFVGADAGAATSTGKGGVVWQQQ